MNALKESGRIPRMSTPTARPQLVIRPACAEDAASLCEIFNEAVQDHMDTFESAPRRADDLRVMIAAAAQDAKHPILVAEVRNWVAGWVMLATYDPHLAFADVGEAYVYVRRSFRGYGVGRQLLRAAEEAAAKLGYRKLIGRILAENRDSLMLCRANGWREVGRYAVHARLGDGLHDVVVVEFLLPSPAPQS
jgi:L-amino acid N-acyltransferase YncA